MLLEDSGAEFDQAENGSEAVELFKANPEKYSLIFMDVQMPMMDGFAAASAIRGSGIAGSMNIPIIAMTANVFTDDIEKCLAAGMNEHVGKPIVIDRLLSVMRKYISRE
jgi:CheY-like chemotaxis protein